MKKEIPILFSTEMVQAILDGRKTMTRRIIKPQPIVDQDSGRVFDGAHKRSPFDIHNWKEPFVESFSRWMPGDLLYVRESWNVEQYPVAPEGDHDELLYYYKATEEKYTDMKWRPSIHMPKAAARIWLEVTDIRVERLCDITEADAKAEGVKQLPAGNYQYYLGAEGEGCPNAGHSFASLWRKINGHDGWEANPWVWVVSFKKAKK